MKILTGFEPFGKFSHNPSWEAVREINGAEKFRIPVKFREAIEWGERIIKMKPDIVIATGLSPSTRKFKIEALALNIMHSTIPDSAGFSPKQMSIYKEGKTCHLSPVPYFELAEHLNEKGIPSTVSFSAGVYVCNTLYYSLLHNAERVGLKAKIIFIHVPPTEDALGKRCRDCWDIERIKEGIAEAMDFISRLSSP